MDTNFYQQALAEFQQANPNKRRATDVTTEELSGIMSRAQQLKKEATCSSQSESSMSSSA